MSNPVLAEAGALAAGQELMLTRFGSSTEEPVRGVFARLAETPADVQAAWSRGGKHVWTEAVRLPEEIEFLTVTGQGRDSGKYRVIFRETIVGLWATEHFVLQDEAMP